MDVARAAGARTILDPAPAQPLPATLLRKVDILTPNESEACILLGRDPARVTFAEATEIAGALRGLGVGAVILKLGDQGCFYSGPEGEFAIPGFAVQPVDTTAAGDTFNAGFAVAMAEGMGIEPALRFGNAAAATTTVATGELAITASADGQTEADRTYDVYPDVSGTVERVEVSLGDKVKAGDTLFTIDDASLQSAVRSANAQLSAAKSQVSQANQQVAQANQQLDQAEASQFKAENNLHSLQSLTGTAAASSARIAEAKNDVAVAKAGVTTAKAGVTSANASLSSAKVARNNAEKSLADARSDLDKVTVTAPADGVVTSVNVVDGGSVSTGGGSTGSSSAAGATASMTGATTSASSGSSAPIVISDSSILIATVAVNEVDIADVKPGQEATVTFDAAAGLAIPAKVRWVSPNATTRRNVRP